MKKRTYKGTPEFIGHFVPIVGYDGENIYVHNHGFHNPKAFLPIKRELFEETGLKSRSAEFLFVHEEMLRRLKLHAEVFVFNIETIGELKRNWEVSESKWFSRSEISKMNLAFTHKDIVNKYFKLKGVR